MTVLNPTEAKVVQATLEPLKLDLNERCEGPADWVTRAQAEIPPDYYWCYIPTQPLERKLADVFDLTPEEVFVTNGGDEAIAYLFADRPAGSRIVIPTPTFGFYREQADIWPVEPLVIPPNPDLTLDLDALTQTISTGTADLVVLVRPNNPTGEPIPADVVRQLLNLCQQRGSVLLLDEAYAEFAADDMVDALADHANLIILRTFSKAYGLAGLRVGYLLASQTLLQPLRARVLPFNVSSLSLYFAERALDHRAEMRAYAARVAANRDRIAAWLRSLDLTVSESQANFLLLHLGETRARFVTACLNAENIQIRTFTRPDLAGCLRITIPADSARLEQSLARILDPQLICLDIDGCLIDVRASFDACVVQTVAHFTGQTADRDEILALRAAGGFNDDNVLSRQLILQRGQDVPLDEVVAVFHDLYFGVGATPGLYNKETPLITADLLERLRTQYQIALITGRNREEAALAVDLLDLPEETDLVTVDDVPVGKPDPEGINRAAKRADAQRVWMLGDNLDDIRAARAAGALAIGVGENREALLAGGAALVLETVQELEALL